MVDFTALTSFIGKLTYLAQALVALWGTYCLVVVWRRAQWLAFRSEREQNAFLDSTDEFLARGDLAGLQEHCAEDSRAVPQLIELALSHRKLSPAKLRELVADRFQRDVLADLEYRVSWVNLAIKSAPMLGLFGTVIGMMGAFATLGASERVEATQLATDIYIALITTAVGLAIAIPLMIAVASVNIRLRKFEDLVLAGLTRFFESYPAETETPPAVRKPIAATR